MCKVQKEDFRYPFAWTYRDYVIRSFNEDKPYNRFLMEQIAADRLSTSQDRQIACGDGISDAWASGSTTTSTTSSMTALMW